MQVKLNANGRKLLGKGLLWVKSTSIDEVNGRKLYHFIQPDEDGLPHNATISDILVEEEIEF